MEGSLQPGGTCATRAASASLALGNLTAGLLQIPCDDRGTRVIQCNVRNISERKRLEDEVRQFAFYDALTRLPNRRLFGDRFDQAMAAIQRNGDFGAVMFLDPDKFKQLNDRHGHAVGDVMLAEVADRSKHCVRAMDTAARFGGDEFVVMIGDLGSDRAEARSQAHGVAETIRAALAMSCMPAVRSEGAADATIEHRSTASIGVAMLSTLETHQDHILRSADAAMFQAKVAGGNNIEVHLPAA